MAFLVEGAAITEVEVKEFAFWVPGMSVEIRTPGSTGDYRKVPEFKVHDTQEDAEEDVRRWQAGKDPFGLPVVRDVQPRRWRREGAR